MFISKSLFKEFLASPKLAWRHINDKKIYKSIQDSIYGAIDGSLVGQTVEELAKKLYKGKSIIEINYGGIYENDGYRKYHNLSLDALKQNPDVIYQAGFLAGTLFIKADFLVRNKSGKYDLVEVKSKNSIRFENKAETLIDSLVSDISFQKYVLKKSLGAQFSGNCFVLHLNKEFRKRGKIKPKNLFIQESVDRDLMTDDVIEDWLDTIRSDIHLTRKEFDKKYPYDGSDYFTYFGKKAPKKSIWHIGGLDKYRRKILYDMGKTMIAQLSKEDISTILPNKDGGDTQALRFMNLWKKGKTVINKEEIKKKLSNLKFPLFFYDYETVVFPIPIFEGTGAWQQVVVQYSVHKVDKTLNITHKECIINPGEISNKRIIDNVVRDLEHGNGTYIVRNKQFENSRNRESGQIYAEYQQSFESINNNTFDLMTIFSELLYFDRDFLGSSSIKKVLPVLTDISYDSLEVGNGGLAMTLLLAIQQGLLTGAELEQTKKNLLTYCEQDSFAMFKIWEVVKNKLN